MRYGPVRTLSTVLLLAAVLCLAGPAPAQEPDPAGPEAVDEPAAAVAEPAASPAEAPADEAAAAEPPVEIAEETSPAEEPVPAAASSGEAAGAMTVAQDTAAGVYDQGRRLWSEALVPMAKRFAAAAPVVLKAVVVLAVFWILAVALGAATRKLLGLTSIDDRIARDWGLDTMLRGAGDEPRSIDRLGGTVVKWIVLLFGFVAFFDALDLGMVAGPLQGILNNIAAIVPAMLKAVVILLGYWIVATILKMGVSRGLATFGFDERAGKYLPPREVKGVSVPASGLVGRLVFYVVLLFGVPPFLDALGQEALVTPLRDMLSKALTYVPNVIAALILVFVGRLVATVVREVAANFLVAVGLDR